MITAAEALALARAQLTPTEREDVRQVLRDLEEYIRENVTFAGLPDVHILIPDVPTLNIAPAIRARRHCR